MKICSVGVSGKLGQYMVPHALDRGHQVVGVCRKQSLGKLDVFAGRITIVPGTMWVSTGRCSWCDGLRSVAHPSRTIV
jgi:nucleoside-diphosphate-sugar epimerase